jgi:hypothetical protein
VATPLAVPIGTDVRTLKDPTGKAYGGELCAAARKPEGQVTEVTYMFLKPGTTAPVVPKVTFMMRRMGSLGCGVGYYNDRLSKPSWLEARVSARRLEAGAGSNSPVVLHRRGRQLISCHTGRMRAREGWAAWEIHKGAAWLWRPHQCDREGTNFAAWLKACNEDSASCARARR